MNRQADVRIDEHGDTWIRVDTPCGPYQYNKTRMEALEAEAMAQPIRMEAAVGGPVGFPLYVMTPRPLEVLSV